MKNAIMYYYEIDNISVYKMNDTYRVEYNDKIYLFEPLKINIDELKEIMNLNFENNKYHKIIGNKDKTPITNINGQNYIMLKKETNINPTIYNEILRTIDIPKAVYRLDRSNWCLLWSNKIDYFEYQLNHLEEKYKLISESIDYYIGMTESAISYIRDTINNEQKTNKDILCVCHKRIENNNYYHPFNIVFDYKARDISEYLKYLFISKEYINFNLESFIIKLNFSKFSYRLLYGRMFYPSFYFDIYEKIINESAKENELTEIIKRIDEYEKFINTIYNIINKKNKIQKIDWI